MWPNVLDMWIIALKWMFYTAITSLLDWTVKMVLESPVLAQSVLNPQAISCNFLRRKGGHCKLSYKKNPALINQDRFKGYFGVCHEIAT